MNRLIDERGRRWRAALACTASPAFADDEYSTDEVAPSWTAASAESCADPDVAPVLCAFEDDDFYAPAPGGAFENGAGRLAARGGASVAAAAGGLNVLGMSTARSSSRSALPPQARRSASTSATRTSASRSPRSRWRTDSDVRVEVVYPGLEEKNVRKAKDVKAKHGRGWELSDNIKLKPDHGLKNGGWRLVAIRHPREGRQAGRARAHRRRARRPARARLVAQQHGAARSSALIARRRAARMVVAGRQVKARQCAPVRRLVQVCLASGRRLNPVS